MRKYLIAFLLSLSCACAMAATACGEPDISDSSSTPSTTPSTPIYKGTRTVEFEEGEGFRYVTDVVSGSQVEAGTNVEFTIDLGAFYSESNPTVFVNGAPVAHDGNGNYSIPVKDEDLVIHVENIRKDVADLYGTGTMEDPFLIYKAADLVYIADQVNAGKQSYVQGAYVLMNDIDCKGEELKVIGDLSTENSFFSGCFSCYIDENGQRHRFTISNFKINSQNANYVGLFGAVQTDLSVQSSGLFYGIRIDNFVIEAGISQNQGDSDMLCVGSLVGYGAGANLILCEATNGTINMSGNSGNFSFAGGLMGYQQAYYYEEYDQYFASEIAHSKADVDIIVQSGITMYAGGISGYLTTNYPLVSTPSIHNSISTGEVAGALRSGGIAGGLAQYAVVSNCYASGDIYAECSTSEFSSLDEYYIAAAGGLVGWAENDSIVHDSAFLGTVSAYAAKGDNYSYANPFVGTGYDAQYVSPTSQKYLAINCIDKADLSNAEIFTQQLGWGDYDWIFEENKLPEIYAEDLATQVSKTMTIYYVAPNLEGNDKSVKVNKANNLKRTYFDTSIESSNMYTSFGSFLAGNGLQSYYQADNGFVSFGYFFDEACTQRVPYSYFPEKDVTLYVGFSDLTPVVGTYYVENGSEKGFIQLRNDGIARYTDGASEQEAYYSFDGHNIFIDGARLVRFYKGSIVESDDTSKYYDANFDLYRYQYYNFAGSVENGVLSLYDGSYFTKDAPLTASVGGSLTPSSDYSGTWVMTANLNSELTIYNDSVRFNGKSANIAWEESGFSFVIDGENYYANFNSDGFLELVYDNATYTYYRNGSYVGTWTNDAFSLSLEGLNKDGKGLATLTYADGLAYELVYEATPVNGYLALYLTHNEYWKDLLFGYFSYNAYNHVLSTVITDANSATGYAAYTLQTLDDLYGDWITNATGLTGAQLSFNGKGLYDGQGFVTITIGNNETKVSYSLNNQLVGSFTYNGNEYTLSYDYFDGVVIVNNTESLLRKDALANNVFVDGNGNEYVFDGKSPLGKATFSVNGELSTYTYGADGDDYLLYDNATEVGRIARQGNRYVFTLNGVSSDLYIKNEFMGEWAMSGLFTNFSIGPTDLNGVIQGNYMGRPIQLTEYDYRILTFRYTEYNGQPHTYYVYILDDESAIGGKSLVLTESSSLVGGEQIVCSKKHELFGTFKQATGSMTITFDGVKSIYAYGTAQFSFMGMNTLYNYAIKETGIIMWSQEVLSGKIYYYSIKLTNLTETPNAASNPNAWIREDGMVVIREETDSLYLTEIKDNQDNVYLFANKGEVRQNGVLKYTYDSESISYNNSKSTIEVVLTDVETGVSYKCTISQFDYTFTLEEVVSD